MSISLTEFIDKFNLKNKAISLIKVKEVLNELGKIQMCTLEIVNLQQLMDFWIYIQQEEHIGLYT